MIRPEGRAYRGSTVQLDLLTVPEGETQQIEPAPGDEAVLVLLDGAVEWDGRHATRASVFSARASAVFLPPGRSVSVRATSDTELALAATVDARLADDGAATVFVAPDDVRVHERGRPGWQRAVHDVVAEGVPARRLIVGETFNRPGEWSSFPPHKHDGADGEPALEEVYYYRFDQPDGFGVQCLYESDGEERAVFLRHGAVVGIPRGYHPVAAAPGSRLYYLWALAGSPRRLALHEDPAHRWLHDT